MSELTRRNPNQITRPTNRSVESRTSDRKAGNERALVKRPTRAPAEQAFRVPNYGYHAEGRIVERQPVDRLIVIEKRVMDSQLKNVLIALATMILVAFVVGLVLWAMS